jgi:hypothetical protein
MLPEVAPDGGERGWPFIEISASNLRERKILIPE